MTIPDKHLETFMRDSNKIEGEVETDFDKIFFEEKIMAGLKDPVIVGSLNPDDIEAARFALEADFSDHENILTLHEILGRYLKEDWVGKWRKVPVRVGNYIPPNPGSLRRMMIQYCGDWNEMDSWKAHNRFESVHPFQDLNGRTGRLIWLAKAVREGYRFGIPFLHKYYYQTLDHQDR